MYTFLFAAQVSGMPPEALLASAASITQQVAPSFGVAPASSITLLPEVQGGWVRIVPEPERVPTLISESVDAQRAVLAFGSLQHGAGRTTAEAIHAAWVSGGIAAVRALEGAFGAVLVDRARRQVSLVSDLMGRGRLRYVTDGSALLASPHDVPLVATGRAPVEMDLDSASSILSIEWSLQGRGLLKSVAACDAGETVRWTPAGVERVAETLIDPSAQIEAGDRRGVRELNERLIEVMREDARRFVDGHAMVETDLTAGIDTRAVLGLLLSVTEASRLHARCHGEPSSRDVIVAREVARRGGVRFSADAPQPPTVEEFVPHGDLRAFYMNGDTCGKRAYQRLPRYAPAPVPRACGRGGGVLKNLYLEIAEYNRQPCASPAQARQFMLRQAQRGVEALPWQEPEAARQAVTARMASVLDGYAPMARTGSDLLELFYLLERNGVWGAMDARLPWLARYWSPFNNPALVPLLYRFPRPIDTSCVVHATLIRRYVPSSYWIRINGQRLLALDGPGWARRLLREADRRVAALEQAARRRLSGQRLLAKGMEETYAAAFAGPLAGVIRDIVGVAGGVGEQLFGRAGVARLLEQHQRTRNFLEPVGSLVTMERWRSMVHAASRLAASP